MRHLCWFLNTVIQNRFPISYRIWGEEEKKEPLCKFTDRLFYSIWKRRRRGSDDEMRFVGNHFIEISTGMEEDGKKRRENCKSRAISRRFFSSRTDHAKGRKGEERRTKAGEDRKFNFHMEIWFCRGRYTQVVLSKKEEKGTTAIYCPKNSSKLHFHTPQTIQLSTRGQNIYFIHKCCRHVSEQNRSKYFPLREKW